MSDPLRGEPLSIEVTAGVAEMVAAWAEEGLKGEDKPVAREAIRRFRQAFNDAASRSLSAGEAARYAEFRRVMTFLEAKGVRLVRGYGYVEDSVHFGGHRIRALHETYEKERP